MSVCGANPMRETTNRENAMTEYNYEDNTDTEDEYEFGHDESLLKKLRKQIDSLSKQLKEKDNVIAQFHASSHESNIADILNSFGLNPKIAKFIPDSVAADEDAVSEWLNEYGDAFGISAVEEQAPYEMDADAQSYEQISNFEDGTSDPLVGQDIGSRISNSNSPDELMNYLRGIS
jgi:hypothetical protein